MHSTVDWMLLGMPFPRPTPPETGGFSWNFRSFCRDSFLTAATQLMASQTKPLMAVTAQYLAESNGILLAKPTDQIQKGKSVICVLYICILTLVIAPENWVYKATNQSSISIKHTVSSLLSLQHSYIVRADQALLTEGPLQGMASTKHDAENARTFHANYLLIDPILIAFSTGRNNSGTLTEASTNQRNNLPILMMADS